MKKYSYTNFGVTSPIASKTSVEKIQEQSVKKSIDTFKEYMKTKKPLTINFQHSNEKGDFDTIMEGVHVILPNEGDDWYDARFRSTRLLQQYEVTVVRVDEEKNEVYVTSLQTRDRNRERVKRLIHNMVNASQAERKKIENIVQAEVRELMAGELADEVARMKPRTANTFEKQIVHERMNKKYDEQGIDRVVVPALVKKVKAEGAILDIMGYGIPGYIPRHYWQYGYVSNLTNLCKEGDVVDVAILTYKSKKAVKELPEAGVSGMYVCARTPLMDNPWDNLRYRVGDIVRAKCVSVTGHNWFGKIDGEEIEIYCEFPPVDKNVRVIVGEEYECHIFRIREKSRLIMAATSRKVEGRPTVN